MKNVIILALSLCILMLLTLILFINHRHKTEIYKYRVMATEHAAIQKQKDSIYGYLISYKTGNVIIVDKDNNPILTFNCYTKTP
jgi:hypothetical protein